MADPDPVYFDSCLFIELLQQADQKRFDQCEALREQAQKGDIIIVTSALTITEVNKLPELGGLPEDQSKKILEFFENPYIVVRAVDRRTAEDAHHFTRTHGLTNIDAIHIATALNSRVSVLYTYDSAKKRRKGLLSHNLKIGNPPLRIERPPDPLKGTLFDESKKPKKAEAEESTDESKDETDEKASA
jgi:predicted nucleic acid-binding protein